MKGGVEVTFSALASQTHDTSQKSSRQGTKIDMIICHHAATTNAKQVLDLELTGARQVSSNYIITNTGEIWGVVPEEDRAWTSGASKSQNPTDNGKGAAFDRRAITFECADESNGGSWPISAASQEAIVKLLVDLHQRYGIPLDRDHVVGHRELYTRWGASYATACPGGMDLDDLVKRAVAALSATPQTDEKEDDMFTIFKRDKSGVTYTIPASGGMISAHADGEEQRVEREATENDNIKSFSDDDFRRLLYVRGLAAVAGKWGAKLDDTLPKPGQTYIVGVGLITKP